MKLSVYLRTHQVKLFKSCFCLMSFMGLGACCTLLGSSLLDLQIQMSETFSVTSNLVPSRSIGYLIGGVLSGIIDHWFGPNMILFITNFTAGLFIALAPWFKSFYVVYSLFLISGIAQGIFDITCNTYIFQLWRDNPQLTNYIQALHGAFGVGSLITPLIIQPFILPLSDQTTTTNTTDNLLNVTMDREAAILGDYTPDDVKIQFPFMVVGLLLITAAAGYLFFHIKEKQSNQKSDPNPEGSTTTETETSATTTKDPNDPPRWKKYVGIAMLALIANLTFGIQVLIGSLSPAFAVKSDLHMTKQRGATLVTVFWSVFTGYRVIFILLSNYIGENVFMWVSYASLLISIGVSVPYAAYNQLCIWISMILLGIGFSPLFTVSLSRLQKYFILTNSLASFIFINGSVGESIHPWIATKLMEAQSVQFVYYLGSLTGLFAFSCFVTPYVCEKIFRPQKRIENRNVRTASVRSWTR